MVTLVGELVLHHAQLEVRILIIRVEPVLMSFGPEFFESHFEIVSADNLVEFQALASFDWGQLSWFVALTIAELYFLGRFGSLLPALPVVGLVKVDQEERMQKVHKPVALIELARAINR